MTTKNCPMCLGQLPQESGEPAKTCPHCGADVASWRLKNAKASTLLDCPMCHRAIPVGENEIVKTCPHCGADLARRMPKPFTAPETLGKPRPGRGILVALIGAAVGAGIVYAIYKWTGFHFR